MIERRRGGVLNVGSLAGFLSGPGMNVYYATKAFVLSFTEALAEEWPARSDGDGALSRSNGDHFGNISHGQKNAAAEYTQNAGGNRWRVSATALFAKAGRLAIPGWQYHVLLLLLRIMPRWLVRQNGQTIQRHKGISPKREPAFT